MECHRDWLHAVATGRVGSGSKASEKNDPLGESRPLRHALRNIGLSFLECLSLTMANSPLPRSSASSRHQFSLRVVFFLLLLLSLAFAIALRFPRQSAFVTLMPLLILFPLAVAAVLRLQFSSLMKTADRREPPASHRTMVDTLLHPLRAWAMAHGRQSFTRGWPNDRRDFNGHPDWLVASTS